MVQKLRRTLMALSAVIALAIPLTPTLALAQDPNAAVPVQANVCTGATTLQIPSASQDFAGDSGNCNTNGGATDKVNKLIRQIINIVSVVVGIVAVIMIIVGGFRYVTSGGSTEKVSAAKNTILYALIGLIIVALAQIIVRFVLEKTTSSATGYIHLLF